MLSGFYTLLVLKNSSSRLVTSGFTFLTFISLVAIAGLTFGVLFARDTVANEFEIQCRTENVTSDLH